MRKLLLLVFITAFLLLRSQAPTDTARVCIFRGASIDVGKDIKETSDKGFIIGGYTSSFGDGNTSFYLIKTDSFGVKQWSQTYGTGNNDLCMSVELANDGGYYLCGYSNNNIPSGYDGYVVKTNSLGITQWARNYGWSDWDFIYNSAKMPDGGLILCGETYSGSQGGTDALLIRLNSNGDTIWTKKIGTTGDDALYGVKVRNNRIYAVGKAFDVTNNKTDAATYKLDFGGNILKSDLYVGNLADQNYFYDLYISTSGDILTCGKRTTNNLDNYLIRQMDTLNLGQVNLSTSNQNIYFRSIAEGNNSDIYVLGPSYGQGAGGISALFWRLAPGIWFQNAANFGGADDDEGNKIIRTSKGYAFVGWTNSYGNQPGDKTENVYLVIFDINDLVNEYILKINIVQDDLSPVGIENFGTEKSSASLYPNPVQDQFWVKFSDTKLEGEKVHFQLLDASGKLIDDQEIAINKGKISLSRKIFVPGVFFYRITHNSALINSGKLSAE